MSIVNCKAHSALLAPVRLACVRHAASVRPEPGSNSLLIHNSFILTAQFPQLRSRFSALAPLGLCCLTGPPMRSSYPFADRLRLFSRSLGRHVSATVLASRSATFPRSGLKGADFCCFVLSGLAFDAWTRTAPISRSAPHVSLLLRSQPSQSTTLDAFRCSIYKVHSRAARYFRSRHDLFSIAPMPASVKPFFGISEKNFLRHSGDLPSAIQNPLRGTAFVLKHSIGILSRTFCRNPKIRAFSFLFAQRGRPKRRIAVRTDAKLCKKHRN